uniref:Uncharacterized protein n=1 Tax=Craspedostauros australis TaxID=1486917 RepID=A0A7R9WVX5_9STRA|mmetsp:Transcript_23371/g.65202  ORF Transcript_23371/g.65202 Transcript_23371/m.65202 type:complete len:310 (+) Transcript_23371:249-1178(+)
MQHQSLACEQFEQAVAEYLDEYKPDPIQRRQIQDWSLSWTSHDDVPASSTDATDLPFEPTHSMKGELEIQGVHVVLTLRSECVWKWMSEDDSKNGSLQFILSARARFRTKAEMNANADATGDASTQQLSPAERKAEKQRRKVEERIRVKMLQRLQKDSYICNLVPTPTTHACKVLATALVHVKDTELEERVNIDDDVAEACRRSVLSTASSPLDLIELLMALPYLPGNSLANRAKLRLLEDAMFDQCEKEGEDELLDGLSICDKTGGDGDGDGDNDDGDNGNKTSAPTQRMTRSKTKANVASKKSRTRW